MTSLLASPSLSLYGDDDDSANKIKVTVPYAEKQSDVPLEPSLDNRDWSHIALDITKIETDHSDNEDHPYLVRRKIKSEFSDDEKKQKGNVTSDKLSRAKLIKRISKSERDVSMSVKSRTSKTVVNSSKSKTAINHAQSAYLIIDDSQNPWADLSKKKSVSDSHPKSSVKGLNFEWKRSTNNVTDVDKGLNMDASMQKSEIPTTESKVP